MQSSADPRYLDDGLFTQLESSPLLYGAFAMDHAGRVVLISGEYADGLAELHAPVIMAMLGDVKALLHTAPSRQVAPAAAGGIGAAAGAGAGAGAGAATSGLSLMRTPAESLRRVTVSYADHTLVVAVTDSLVYVSKRKPQ